MLLSSYDTQPPIMCPLLEKKYLIFRGYQCSPSRFHHWLDCDTTWRSTGRHSNLEHPSLSTFPGKKNIPCQKRMSLLSMRLRRGEFWLCISPTRDSDAFLMTRLLHGVVVLVLRPEDGTWYAAGVMPSGTAIRRCNGSATGRDTSSSPSTVDTATSERVARQGFRSGP